MIFRSSLFVFITILLIAACKQADEKKPPVQKESITTYYLIRHAEKDRSDTTNANPALSQIGNLRAINWVHYFDSIPLNDIYSTDYIRTQQTVLPIASNKKIEVQSYEPKSLITDDFLKKTQGHFVLISGHSNTTPIMVNQLMGAELFPEMNDDDNSSLYVVRFLDGVPNAEIRTVPLPRE
jgi:2,3-bisphosphoglycerate-dependent phosphoglycerate mutase